MEIEVGHGKVVHGGDGRGHGVARSSGSWQWWVGFDFGWVLMGFYFLFF